MEPPIHPLTRLLVAAYLVQVGLVLAVAPWIPLWDRNYFATAWPQIRLWMSMDVVRAAVTTAGLLTLVAGLSDLYFVFVPPPRPPHGGASV